MHPKHRTLAKLALFGTVLAWCVVMLGAYTRLGDAGLGCPDWPGCYGHLGVPQSAGALQDVAQHYGPQTVVEPAKAWKEMVHRYFAGTLGLLIVAMAAITLSQHKTTRCSQNILAGALLLMLIFQAMLGMWTVTWQLLPLIVMGHLLGGMTLTALLWSLHLTSKRPAPLCQTPASSALRCVALIGTTVVALQIFLGGWTTANYASVVCPDFPTCHGQWFPAGMDWGTAFDFASPIGRNYEGGVLNAITRITIQMAHRYGAAIVLCVNLPAAIWLIRRRTTVDKRLGIMLLCLLTLQMLLGILNVVWQLPMAIAVMHNGVALLLLLLWITLVYRAFASDTAASSHPKATAT